MKTGKLLAQAFLPLVVNILAIVIVILAETNHITKTTAGIILLLTAILTYQTSKFLYKR